MSTTPTAPRPASALTSASRPRLSDQVPTSTGRRAKPGSDGPPRSGARSGSERSGARAGCRWCARGAAAPQGPAGPRAASGAPPGGARPAGRGPGARHAPAARRMRRRSRHEPRGCRREAPGWPLSARSRDGNARHESPLGETPRTRHITRTGHRPRCSSQRPERHRAAPPKMSAAFFETCRAPCGRDRVRASAARSRSPGRPATRSAGEGPDKAADEDRRASPIPGSPYFWTHRLSTASAPSRAAPAPRPPR